MKTLREETYGKATLRLLQTKDGYVGVAHAPGVDPTPIPGEDPDVLWAALQARLRQGAPGYFGFDGARARFLRSFEGGFADALYRSKERDYKDEARRFLNEVAPLETAARAGPDDCQQIMRAFAKTNLLSQFEQSRTREVLKGPQGPEFVRAAAGIVAGDVAGGLRTIERVFAPHGQPSWPAATFLPFLWRPETQMFLKPKVTTDFASRVGHPFAEAYSARFSAEVYLSLLDLAAQTEAEITALKPADRIDVQSFIWVVGAYSETDVADLDAARAAAGGRG